MNRTQAILTGAKIAVGVAAGVSASSGHLPPELAGVLTSLVYALGASAVADSVRLAFGPSTAPPAAAAAEAPKAP